MRDLLLAREKRFSSNVVPWTFRVPAFEALMPAKQKVGQDISRYVDETVISVLIMAS